MSKGYQIPLDVLYINVLTQSDYTFAFITIIIITVPTVHSVHTVRRGIQMRAHTYHMSILLNKFLNIQIELKPTSIPIHSVRMNWNDVSRAFIKYWKVRNRHIMCDRITLILINLIRKKKQTIRWFFPQKKYIRRPRNRSKCHETIHCAIKQNTTLIARNKIHFFSSKIKIIFFQLKLKNEKRNKFFFIFSFFFLKHFFLLTFFGLFIFFFFG